MKLEIEAWQLVTLIVSIFGAYFGIARLLLTQVQRAIDEKFVVISESLHSQDEATRRMERDLMALKAELPRDYVRREDYNQAITIITTKIDSLGLRMERLFERVEKRGRANE